MRRGTRTRRYAVGAALLLSLVACGDSEEPGSDPVPTPSDSSTPSGTDEPTADTPSGGTADAPVTLEPVEDPLDWQPVEGSADDVVTRNGTWTLTVAEDGSTSQLTNQTSDGHSSGQVGADPGWRVSDGLLDAHWAVVVLQDEDEEKPSRATVTDLDTGKAYELNGKSDVPTTHGGTWALGEGHLLHATIDGSGAYCLASVDLASRASEVAWCAPKRHGFNSARVSPAGDSVLTFDDAQPACRTVATVAAGTTTPFEGVADCKAWDGIAVEDGAVWSVIPNEERIEQAQLYARTGDGYFDLGPGTAGSLVWCGDAAYFTRDPQQEGDPAALMRWAPGSGLAVVYESPEGDAFIEEPRCGGAVMTLTARTSSGDEQVTADLS